MNSIEKWRKELKLDKFDLIGHSFGGFISTRYTLAFPDAVNKLILWSPLGVEKCPDDYMEKKFDEINKLPLRQRMMFKTFRYFLDKNITPFSGMRNAGRGIAGMMLKKFMKYRLTSVSDDDFDKLYNYLFQILMRKGSSEYALNIMFKHIFMTPTPIIESIEELSQKNIDVSFYYGTKDWMNTTLNDIHISQQLEMFGLKVYLVKESGHHLYFDNPENLIELTFKELNTINASFRSNL